VRVQPDVVVDVAGIRLPADEWTRTRTVHTDLLEPLETNESQEFQAYGRTVMVVDDDERNVGNATANRTPIDASATVTNPTPIPVPITEIRYTVQLNGIVVGRGTAAERTVLEPDSTQSRSRRLQPSITPGSTSGGHAPPERRGVEPDHRRLRRDPRVRRRRAHDPARVHLVRTDVRDGPARRGGLECERVSGERIDGERVGECDETGRSVNVDPPNQPPAGRLFGLRHVYPDMTDFRGTWTEDEVEEFLQEATIPVRIATRRPDDSPWVVTLWFRYRDGSLSATGANADVVRFPPTRSRGRLRHLDQRHPLPRDQGNGTVELSSDSEKTLLRALIERYLGGTESPLAQRLLDDDRDEVRIRLEPRAVYSWDYSERMGKGTSEKSE